MAELESRVHLCRNYDQDTNPRSRLGLSTHGNYYHEPAAGLPIGPVEWNQIPLILPKEQWPIYAPPRMW